MMARLSLCVIARNESRFLGDCLASVAPWVDEVVVVDTGSEDETVEIASSMGARVLHHPWNEDFAEARNVGLAAATGDWILTLDADERLGPGAGAMIRAAIEDPRIDAFFLLLHSAARLDATPEEVVSGAARMDAPIRVLRLFRNVDAPRFTRRVHEHLGEWLQARPGRAGVLDDVSRCPGIRWSLRGAASGHLAAYVLAPSVAVALLRLGRSLRARPRSGSESAPGHPTLFPGSS